MIVKSLFSRISGSAGGITVSNWKGKQVAKERITTNKSQSPAQIFQRARFAYVQAFVLLVGIAFLKSIWARFERQTTYINEFSSPNIKLQPEYVDEVTPFEGDPLLVSISKGSLETLPGISFPNYYPATGVCEVTWLPTITGNGKATDNAFFLVLDLNTRVKYTAVPVTRADESSTVDIPAGLLNTDLLFIIVASQVLLDGTEIFSNSSQVIPVIV